MAKKTKSSGSLMSATDMANPVPVAIVPSKADRPSKSDMDRERKWKAEDALRDIERAEGHRGDKSLMKDVKSMAKEKMNSLKKIC